MIKALPTLSALMAAAMLAACSAAGPQTSAATVAETQSAPAVSPPAAPASASTPAAKATTDAATRTAPVVPGRPGRVFIFAGVDEACTPIAPPALSITRPPAQGDISFKDGQQTVIAATARGTCTGTKATGTGVYYTARAGAQGSDFFSISARMPTGETLERAFSVSIAQ
jgi:hypothetical protein